MNAMARYVEVDGRDVPVRVRVDGRARRLTLRLDPAGVGARLTVPDGVPEHEIARFLTRQRGWLARHLARRPDVVRLVDGAEVPVEGVPHTIRATGRARGTISIAAGTIWAGGLTEHVERRVTDHLRARARDILGAEARDFAAALTGGRPLAGVTVRDTTSRWGSCTANGGLNFSWRLILAPAWVRTYVVAHEVAHLKHMNHGDDFWRTCRDLHDRVDAARTWLKRHGAELHRYGAKSA